MVRVLLTRRWLGALALAAVFATVCVFLGRWQYGRHEAKALRAHLIDTYYAGPAVPLDDVLPRGAAPLPDDQVWRRVEVRGTYDVADAHYVRNRPQNVTYGFEILVPVVLPGGDALVVDRGWVRNAEEGAHVLPDVPPPPAGDVMLTGWLRQGEQQLGRDMPRGQLASIDLPGMAQATGRELRPAYLVLESERTASGTTPARPQPLLPPDTNTGPHFAYALQWWGAAPLGFVLVGFYARREWLDSLSESERAARRRAARPPRPKKTRIWDEEDA